MMINRVHPGTGKAWHTSQDYLRFDRVMKLLADEQGFVYAPAKRFKKATTPWAIRRVADR